MQKRWIRIYGLLGLAWAIIAAAVYGYLIFIKNIDRLDWNQPFAAAGASAVAAIGLACGALAIASRRVRLLRLAPIGLLGLLSFALWRHFGLLPRLADSIVLIGVFLLAGWSARAGLCRLRLRLDWLSALLLLLVVATGLQAILGAFGLANRGLVEWLLRVLALFGSLLLVLDRRRLARLVRFSLARLDCADWLTLAAFWTLANLLALAALMPDLASDAHRVWLPMLRDFLAEGGHRPRPWNEFSLIAPACTYLLSIPYAMQGEPGVRLFSALMGFIFAVAVARGARLLGMSRSGALHAALLILALPIVLFVWYTAQHDAPTFAYSFAGYLMLLRVISSRDDYLAPANVKNLVLAGIFCGFAMAGKLTAVPFIAAALVALLCVGLLRAFRDGGGLREAILSPLLAGCVILCMIAPYWGMAWHWTGDPIYPLLSQADRASRGLYAQDATNWSRSLASWLLAPWYLTFRTRGMIDHHWSGSFGPLLWMFFPFLPLALLTRRRVAVKMTLTALFSFCIIFLSYMMLVRYSWPLYVLLFILLLAGFEHATRRLVSGRFDWLGAAGRSCLTIGMAFLVASFYFTTLWNLRLLPDFLRSHGDRAVVTEKFWPGIGKVNQVLDSLPAERPVAVLIHTDFVAHLTRRAFEFNPGSLATPQAAGWLRESNATALVQRNVYAMDGFRSPRSRILPAPLSNDWPIDAPWFNASSLLAAGQYLIFRCDPALREPGEVIQLPAAFEPLAATLVTSQTIAREVRLPPGGGALSIFLRAPNALTDVTLVDHEQREWTPPVDFIKREDGILLLGRFALEPSHERLRVECRNLTSTAAAELQGEVETVPATRFPLGRLQGPDYPLPVIVGAAPRTEYDAWIRNALSPSIPALAGAPHVAMAPKGWIATRLPVPRGDLLRLKLLVHSDIAQKFSVAIYNRPPRDGTEPLTDIQELRVDLRPGLQWVRVEWQREEFKQPWINPDLVLEPLAGPAALLKGAMLREETFVSFPDRQERNESPY